MSDYTGLLAKALAESGCQTGTLHRFDPDTGLLRLEAQLGLPDQVAKIVANVPIGKGMAGVAAERLEPVQTCNLQTDTNRAIQPGAKAVPVQAGIAIPIIVEGALRGVLGLAKAGYHEWSEAETRSLTELAHQLGRHLESS